MAAPAFIRQLVESLPDEDQDRLRQVLGLDENASSETIADKLVPYARASLAEYIDQFTGRSVPSRVREAEQLRLLRIALHANDGRLPSPDMVAQLFQKDATEAKTLLRNTATRYRYELARSMNDVTWNVLVSNSSKAGQDEWNVEIRDLALLEYMHDSVRRGPGNPTGIQRAKGEMHIYLLDKPTMESLLAAIGKNYASFLAVVEG